MVFAVTSELALSSKKDSDIVTCYLNNNHPLSVTQIYHKQNRDIIMESRGHIFRNLIK